jgi:hypothetical protein
MTLHAAHTLKLLHRPLQHAPLLRQPSPLLLQEAHWKELLQMFEQHTPLVRQD